MEEIIKIETPRIMDLSNPTPDASNAAITSANLKIARLNKALPLLRARVDTIDRETALAECNEEADKHRAESDAIYEELKQLYPPFLQKMMDLYIRARANAAAFNELKRCPPKGADLRFFPAMPYESFWLNLRLPSWNNPGVVYPERQTPEQVAWAQQVMFTRAMCEQTKAIEQKHAQLYSSDWHAVHAEINRKKAEEDDKAEQELKAKDQAARDQYYKELAEAERRRVYGE